MITKVSCFISNETDEATLALNDNIVTKYKMIQEKHHSVKSLTDLPNDRLKKDHRISK